MPFELSYAYTPALAKRAYWQLTWRVQGSYVIGTLVAAAVASFGIWTGQFDRLGAFLLGGVATYWYWWWSAYGQSVDIATHNQHLQLHVTVTEHGVTVATQEATTTFAWVSVSDVYRLASGIVISRRAGGSGALIPAEELTPALRDFIDHHAYEAGAQLR